MLVGDIFRKMIFSFKADRIGPDIPFTHWMLHYTSSMLRLCRKKFMHFDTGADFRAGAYAICCSNISIGKNVVVRPASMLFASDDAKIILGDNVMMGAGVHFYVNNHRFDRCDIPIIDQGYYPEGDIVVKEGAWLGAACIILQGVTIGRNAVIGAGSIVTKDVPDFCVAVGSPAKVIKQLK